MVERRDFTPKEIENAWEKASKVLGYDSDKYRKDYAGAWIIKSEYGNRKSNYGWEVDHVRPLSKGGTYDLLNLVPLHWSNNVKKDDDYPHWTTDTSSEGNQNVSRERFWEI
jgi:hypothetical protein